MKLSHILIIFLLIIQSSAAFGQIVILSYPINRSVTQRNSSDNANVTIAGQYVSSNLSVTASYRFRPVAADGTLGTPGSATTLTLAGNGMFFATPSVSKGWYLCEVLINGVVYASARFGVGDVFIVAGQSNGQGYRASDWALPSTTSHPEWIVGSTEENTCTNTLPQSFTSFFSFRTASDAVKHGALGPTGNTIWCYGRLGEQISTANGGMPVAFFNAASGGSTITQWYNGSQGLAAPNGYRSGAQFCDGLGYTGPFLGQPYTPLKTSLNYYASLFGVRAVLWHQGEADADGNLGSTYKASSTSDYQNKLQYVINKSRTDFGASNLSWLVSNVSISEFGPLNTTIRAGQTGVLTPASANAGPDTDYVTGSTGTTTATVTGVTGYRRDKTHFEENYTSALTWLGDKWYSAIGSNGNRISAGFVPSLTYSKSGSWRTLTAPSGGAQYKWGYTINGGIAGATSNVFTTDQSWTGIRCFIKDFSGNWHVSAAVNVGQYSSQRESAEITSDESLEESEFELKTFPNPYIEGFTVEFSIPKNSSEVILEIVDKDGNVVRKIVENPHAKGSWKYTVKDLRMDSGKVYYCRLKVNESFIVKRIMKLSK